MIMIIILIIIIIKIIIIKKETKYFMGTYIRSNSELTR